MHAVNVTKSNISFMIKALKKLGIKQSYLNIIKAIYDKTKANIILNEEKLKLKSFVLKPGITQRVSTLSTFTQYSALILSKSNKGKKKKQKGYK
jgi:hypothetical protein